MIYNLSVSPVYNTNGPFDTELYMSPLHIVINNNNVELVISGKHKHYH